MLIFLVVMIIAFLFVKGFGADLAQQRGETLMATHDDPQPRRQRPLGPRAIVVVVLYALVPVAWIVSLSLKPADKLTDGKFFPRDPDVRQLPQHLQGRRSSRTRSSTRSASR